MLKYSNIKIDYRLEILLKNMTTDQKVSGLNPDGVTEEMQ